MSEQSSPITRPQTEEDDYEYVEEGGGSSGCAWSVIGALGCLTILVIVIGSAVFLGYNTVDGVVDGISSIFNPPPPVYNTLSTALILDRVQGLSELTTTRHNFSNIVTSERELPSLLQALYRDKLTIVVVGHINAGIDLSQLSEQDIQLEGGVLTLRLPPPRLQDCFLNESESYVVSRETGLFASPAPNLDTEARRFAVREFRDAAIEKGILQAANEQASTVIRSTLELFLNTVSPENINTVQIETTPPDPDAPLPESCQ